jgi:hypothetical protein
VQSVKTFIATRPGRALLAAIVAVLASVGVTVAVTTSDDGSGHKSTTVTVTARNGPQVEAPKAQVQQLVQSGEEQNLGAEKGVTPQVLKKQDAVASPQAPIITGAPPLASAHQNGCLTRAIPTNWSYRNGTRPSLVLLHYTVSRNVPGWSDVNSIVAFFSRSATQASSNYVIDNEGHCVLMVPESEKAWAQAGFNSATACSIEVINSGGESSYIGSSSGPGARQLARVVHDCEARWHIPNRYGAVSGCVPTRSGVVQHADLGLCGGGHRDIEPFGRSQVARVIASAGSSPKPISAAQRKHCTELNTLRRRSSAYHAKYHLKPVKPLSAKDKKRAAAILAGEKKNGLSCRVGSPGKKGSLTRR